jgi:glycosyltransferase involved in cell wall biosynthesis
VRMSRLPSISVLSPARLKEEDPVAVNQLARALDSVLLQSNLGEVEILLLDDASSKPIADFADQVPQLRDRRVRVIRFRQHVGLVHALNAGLALATHPWIARIDIDDYWSPGKLVRQFDLVAANPSLTLIGTGMNVVDTHGNVQATHIRPGTWKGIIRFTREVGSPFPHGSILALRSAYRVFAGYDHNPRLRHCEDFALWCKWIRFLPAAMVEEALYNYTISPMQVSNVHTDQQRAASGMVHGQFLRIVDAEQAPEILESLAHDFGWPIQKLGMAAALAWRLFGTIACNPVFVDRLRLLMPDREVLAVEELPYSHADRFCHFGPRPVSEIPNHVRHSIELSALAVGE